LDRIDLIVQTEDALAEQLVIALERNECGVEHPFDEVVNAKSLAHCSCYRRGWIGQCRLV